MFVDIFRTKKHLMIAVSFGMLFALPQTSLFAGVDNVLGNRSFEEVLGGTGNWDNTANRGISRVAGGTDGSFALVLDEADLLAGAAGAFTFQTVTVPVSEGSLVAFRGQVNVTSLDGGDAAQLRIEYQTSSGGVIADNIGELTAVTGGFVTVSTRGVAPAGTEQITFTLRIQPSAVGGTSRAVFDNMQGSIRTSPSGRGSFK